MANSKFFESIYKATLNARLNENSKLNEMARAHSDNLRQYLKDHPEVIELYLNPQHSKIGTYENAMWKKVIDDYFLTYVDDAAEGPKSKSKTFSDSIFPIIKSMQKKGEIPGGDGVVSSSSSLSPASRENSIKMAKAHLKHAGIELAKIGAGDSDIAKQILELEMNIEELLAPSDEPEIDMDSLLDTEDDTPAVEEPAVTPTAEEPVTAASDSASDDISADIGDIDLSDEDITSALDDAE